MAYVTYKNRSSSDYRFTVESLDDPAISGLKDILKKDNAFIVRARRLAGLNSYWGKQSTKGLRIRPRGPRVSAYAHDTPWENATHYDVYVREYR